MRGTSAAVYDHPMDHGQPGGGIAPDASRPRPTPRPPLLRRMPAAVWTAAAGGVAAAYALLVFTTLPLHGTPNMPPHRFVAYPWELRVGVATAMAAPLVLVRRRPEIALGLLLVLSVGAWLYLARSWPPFVAATVIVGRLAASRRRRTGIAAAGALAGVWVAEIILGWMLFPHGNMRISNVLSMSSAALLMAAVAWTAGNSVRQSRAYSAALHTEAATRMVVAERLRIARELHDSVAHSMGIIAIQAGAARRVLDTQPENARQALGAIETTSREALAGMRRMLGALRRAEAEPSPAAPAPGLADVDRLAATTTAAAGVRVAVRWHGRPRPLPTEIDTSAYRIIQESVTNVVRHAGSPDCRVTVDYRDAELAIDVVDTGSAGARAGARRGGAVSEAADGYGITGMRERVSLLHGRFSAGPEPDGGFRVSARLPVPA